MRHLTIIYNERTLFDGEVAELSWADSDNGVKVEGRMKPRSNGSGGGFMDMLAGLSKAKPASQIAEEKREAYEAEEALCE